MASFDELFNTKQDDSAVSFDSLFSAPETVNPMDETQRVLGNNDRNRQIVAALGEQDPTKRDKTPFLDKLFGVLDTPGTGVRALVHNAFNSPRDKDVDIAKEMFKSLKGQERVTGAHILSDAGVENKWAKLLGGFAIDVALDPTTYLTGGLSNVTKMESVARMAKLADTGLDITKAAEYGLEAARLADRADDTGRVAAALLTKDEARTIAQSIRKMVGKEAGDLGGIKFAGMTVAPVQGKLEKAAYAAKDILRKTPGTEWFEKAFINGDYTEIARLGNEVFDAGFRVKKNQAIAKLSGAKKAGQEFQERIEKLIPDAQTRDLVTLGIGRQFGEFSEQGGLRTAYDALSEAVEAGDEAAINAARSNVQTAMRELWNPDAITDTLTQAGITDPTLLAKVNDAATVVQSQFDELTALRGEAGLPNWTLYGTTPEGAPTSAGYVPGMSPRNPTKGDTAASQAALDALGIQTPDLVEQGRKAGISVNDFLAKPTAYKSKKYLNAEQRMVEGGLLTELDIAKLAGAKTTKDYADIALADWQTSLQRMLPQGAEMSDEMASFVRKTRDAFTNDEATRGFLRAYDKVLNGWKKAATIYNLPRFPLRNGLSNQWLLWSENLFDADAGARAWQIVGKQTAGKALTKAEQDIVERATAQGVVQQAEDFLQLINGGRTNIPGLKQFEGISGGANAMVENQSRLAAFITATEKKGLSDEAARLMVDKALYDYSGGALTEFETQFVKRIIPFYTWMKQNTKHLVELTVKSPGKITATTHLVENARAASPVDGEIMPDWMRENMAIPLPITQDGETQMLTLKGLLPVGDLENLTPAQSKSLEGIPEPFKTLLGTGANVLSNMSPIIKTPLEIVMNRDLYYGDQVQEFAGQPRRAPSYVEMFNDVVENIPGIGDLWGGVKEAFNIAEVPDEGGESYLVMDARAAKAMRDLLPWFNYVGRAIERTPESELSRWGRTLGVPIRSFETEKFTEQKAYDDQAVLQEFLRAQDSQGRGEDIEALRELIPAAAERRKQVLTVDDLFGGR